jgi:hypothetical protein
LLRACAEKEGLQVNALSCLPVVEGRVFRASGQDNPRIIDGNMECAVPGWNLLNELSSATFVCHILHVRERLPVFISNGLCHSLDRARVDIGYRNDCPLLSEASTDRLWCPNLHR